MWRSPYVIITYEMSSHFTRTTKHSLLVLLGWFVRWCCLLICRCINIVNTMKSGHSSLEKYTSHFIRKVYCVRGELETEQNCNIWPPTNSSGYNCISFPFSWAAQPGAWGPSLCWDMVLIPASSLQPIWTSCRRGYIIIWHPPTSCERHICTQFNPSTFKVIPWSPDIFNRMHLLFTRVHFFFWQLARGQYVTMGV